MRDVEEEDEAMLESARREMIAARSALLEELDRVIEYATEDNRRWVAEKAAREKRTERIRLVLFSILMGALGAMIGRYILYCFGW